MCEIKIINETIHLATNNQNDYKGKELLLGYRVTEVTQN